jgi:polyhydroxyalkanoate synthesis regulator phasin
MTAPPSPSWQDDAVQLRSEIRTALQSIPQSPARLGRSVDSILAKEPLQPRCSPVAAGSIEMLKAQVQNMHAYVADNESKDAQIIALQRQVAGLQARRARPPPPPAKPPHVPAPLPRQQQPLVLGDEDVAMRGLRGMLEKAECEHQREVQECHSAVARMQSRLSDAERELAW